MLKLFHSTGSCSLAARIALEEAGADYECVFVDTKAGDQRTAEFLALNPKGRVPALQTDRGVLTENPAILAWVAQSFPAARLAPLDDAWAFAQAQAFNSYLCATVHVARAHMYRAPRWADDPAAQTEMRRKAPEAIASGFQLIEDGMLAGPWVLGGTYSICDGYLFTLADWMDVDGMDIRNFPRVHDHRERMRVRPAVDRALAGGAA